MFILPNIYFTEFYSTLFWKIKKSKRRHTKNCYFPLTIQECLPSSQIILNHTFAEMRFIKKIAPLDLWAKNFHTLKVRKLRLFLLKKKQRKCINIIYFTSFFVQILLPPKLQRRGLVF